ncbi:MAG: magnesium/cobalt efflux protein, partial [Gammaproteobacteria bacterium]|nr:magnesium/cobalt efflux protein [Gammaproteobacteria bacterium]
GHLPQLGDSIEIDGLVFKVLRADSRRLYLLRVTTAAFDVDH